jgi:hypothetical protein
MSPTTGVRYMTVRLRVRVIVPWGNGRKIGWGNDGRYNSLPQIPPESDSVIGGHFAYGT